MPNKDDDGVGDSSSDTLHGRADTVVTDLSGDWTQVVDKMEEMADRYRDDGWRVLEVHPGDVVPLSPDDDPERWGLDAVVPDDEITALQKLLEADESTLTEWDIYREEVGDVVYILVAVRDDEQKRIVFIPLYYRTTDAVDMAQAARRQDHIQIHLRPLSLNPVITLTQADPELFLSD